MSFPPRWCKPDARDPFARHSPERRKCPETVATPRSVTRVGAARTGATVDRDYLVTYGLEGTAGACGFRSEHFFRAVNSGEHARLPVPLICPCSSAGQSSRFVNGRPQVRIRAAGARARIAV